MWDQLAIRREPHRVGSSEEMGLFFSLIEVARPYSLWLPMNEIPEDVLKAVDLVVNFVRERTPPPE